MDLYFTVLTIFSPLYFLVREGVKVEKKKYDNYRTFFSTLTPSLIYKLTQELVPDDHYVRM